jgi:hypothetical protein
VLVRLLDVDVFLSDGAYVQYAFSGGSWGHVRLFGRLRSRACIQKQGERSSPC